jgi:hypothetical protein
MKCEKCNERALFAEVSKDPGIPVQYWCGRHVAQKLTRWVGNTWVYAADKEA